MCSITFKLQEKSFCSHTYPRKQTQEEPRRELLWVTGFALGGREAGLGVVRLQAEHGAKQTENCRSKRTLGSESCCVFAILRISSCT